MTERRMSGRFEPMIEIPARIGRRDGVVVNVSRRGVRVRHGGSLKVNEMIDVVFPCAGTRFASRARVLSCRVVAVRGGEGPVYESRFEFHGAAPEMLAALDRFLTPRAS